jgi:hypothetical protein
VIARLAISTSVYALVLAAARAYPPELVDVVMRRGG